MTLPDFHPAVRDWFFARYSAPTEPQAHAWPAIMAGGPVLVAAPTGSGKTLTGFLSAIDQLVRLGLAGELPDETRVLYVSPLKALSNDIGKNLDEPLRGISETLQALGHEPPVITTHVRTGDTSAKDRSRALKHPAHIQVTTPESLYVLLTSEGGRRVLSNVRLVIVDEIHALLRDKRGAHLALSLERLDALVAKNGLPPVQRVGLSATQKPIEEVARFLVGQKPAQPVRIVDSGHRRKLDLSLEIPRSPLEAVLPLETWQEIYDRLAELVREHKTTLVFTNTRRLSERITRFLAERIGDDLVTSHHGSLSHALRKDAEDRLKDGRLRALVATASLELGIDVGDVDLVCQIGSPGSIATFLQRVGRSGHFVGGTPKGRLFPLSRDDLVESAALLDSVQRGELDQVRIVDAPLDILAQQIVATVAAEEMEDDALFALVRGAYPYRNLTRESFDAVLEMLSEGFTTARGRRAAYIHRDEVGKRVLPRRSARLTALTSGGAIPENFDYEVVLAPTDVRVGSVHEDFAIESQQGDIFQLGNTSYQILKMEPGVLRVSDAHGAPPTIPFWIGEAPSRSPELSVSVSRLRERIDEEGMAAMASLTSELGIPAGASEQLVEYLVATRNALGVMPTQTQLVAERFFDETGGMHLVVHAPFGSRFMRAFGLALRKRFCRSFNVELQAAAGEDALVLSLGPMHSFPLETVFEFLSSKNVEEVLVQALLDAPLFQTRFRWNASRALAIPRFRGGKKVPPRFQRMETDDLLALCFPDQVACLENIAGDREIPDHPLVQQTIDDALHEAMDVDELLRVLRGIESGEIACFARDLKEPSPLSHEIIGARPYAFLDDAPLEERRTQAIQRRRFLTAEDATQLGELDAAAIEQVILEARPDPRDPEELHDALCIHGYLSEAEGRAMEEAVGKEFFAPLAASRRVARVETTAEDGARTLLWVAAERAREIRAIHPSAAFAPEPIDLPSRSTSVDRDSALLEMLRGRFEMVGPTTVHELARSLGISDEDAQATVARLEAEGFVLRGSFRPHAGEEFCERRLLARIHRSTLGRLRREIEPVSPAVFIDFLTQFQGLETSTQKRGLEGTFAIIDQLAGFPIAGGAWESSILPARIHNYSPSDLDALCLSGRVTWSAVPRASAGPVKSTPIRISPRERDFPWLEATPTDPSEHLGADARRLYERLRTEGASFFPDLTRRAGLLPSSAETALRELVARGLATTDSFAGLRTLLTPADKRPDRQRGRARSRPSGSIGMNAAGRVSCVLPPTADAATSSEGDVSPERLAAEALTDLAWLLLRRWGVVFRKLLEREVGLPPWRDLLRVLHRLEARGEIRGGRFVNGFSGEQFALPDAVATLRQLRRHAPSLTPIRVSGVDPLNLVGILTPDDKISSVSKSAVLWVGGVAAAVSEAGEARILSRTSGLSDATLLNALRVTPSLGRPHPSFVLQLPGASDKRESSPSP